MATYYDEGRYLARITNQTFGENKNGNPEVQLTIKPVGQYAEQDKKVYEISDGTARERTIYLTLTEATIGSLDKPGWVLQTLNFLGFRGESFRELDPAEEGHHSFVGLEVDALCQHKEWNGNNQERWSILRPNGTKAEVKRLEKKSIRGLDAKYGKLLKKLAKDVPPAGSGEAAEVPEPVNGEVVSDPNDNPADVPF